MTSDIFVSFGADTGGLEAGVALAKASVTAMTRELTSLAREMVKAGASADSELGQKLSALGGKLAEAKEQVSGFKEKLKQEGGEGNFLSRMKEQLEGVLSPISEVRESLSGMIEVLAATFAVEKIADWISETTEAAEKIERMAAKLGVSAEQVQAIGAIAKLTGGDVDQMASQLERLQLSLAKTGSKASPVAAALKVLGINLAEFRSASIAGQVDLMAEAFSRFADGSGKTAAAMALLGRTGADMIPFFDKGREGLEELRKAAEATGVIMSEQTVAAFSKTREDLNLLSIAWTGLSQKIYALVNPAVDAATKALTHLIESANPAALQAYLTTFATSLVGGAANVATFAVQAKAEWDKLVAAITGSVPTIVGDLQKIADGLNGLMASFKLSSQEQAQWASGYANLWHNLGLTSDETHDKAIAAARALYQSGQDGAAAFGGLDAAAARTSMQLSDIASGAENAKRQIAALLAEGAKQGGLSRHGEGEGGLAGEGGAVKPQVPQMDIGGAAKAAAEMLKIAEAEASAEVDAFKKAAAAREKLLDEQLKMHQLTMGQWQAQTVDALADEEQDVKAAYDRELQAAGLTSAQIITIKKKEADAIADIEEKITATNAKAAEDEVKQWTSVASSIAGIMNSQVNGLLRGTETIAQAFRNMAASAIENLIKLGIQIAAQAAALEALSIISGGALGGFGAGGVGSWLVGALFPSHATGTPYVQNTGLAVIHQGEMVTPAHLNPNNPRNSLDALAGGSSPYTGGGSSGGGVTNHTHNWGGVHVNTGGRDLDPADVAKAMDKAVRSGAHTGLKAFSR
jgi:hypothetical protein